MALRLAPGVFVALARRLAMGASLALAACGTAEDEGIGGVPSERLAAVVAVYGDVGVTGAPTQRIVLFDTDDPARFEAVTPASGVAVAPVFGPEKRRLLWQDEGTGEVHDAQFTTYALPYGPPQPLFESIGSAQVELVGREPVWDAAGAGFYYHRSPRPAAPTPSVLYYGLAGGRSRVVAGDGTPGGVLPVAQISPDTLLVFSGEGAATGGPIGLYYMGADGRYLGAVENPRLRYVNRDGVIRQAALSPDWDPVRRLLAVAYVDSTRAGYRIAVADLRGRVWRELTDGESIDDHPVWGPGGTILFDRRRPFDTSFAGYRVLAVDVETGQVRTLVEPRVFGATGLRHPSF